MKPHILVVEDEKHLGVGIKYNLEAENYRVTLVEDGPNALKAATSETSNIDLIVLDLMLPGMSGYTVCESIREAGLSTPILMLSARTLAEDRTRGFDVGANQYMSKPFDLDELISRIKNLLQNATVQTKPAPQTPSNLSEIEFADIHVNFETYQASVRGKSVRLTSKEIKVLHYFLENEGRVISRNELLTEVWNLSGNIQTRAVDQVIARLRKIIEPNKTNPTHLLTVRDAGYRFVIDPKNLSDSQVTPED
ncbi:MAG: response regulator transcription factor [Planctomycetota bacterium]|nr:response regulator transcription factor [Planctomycetota bacterium]